MYCLYSDHCTKKILRGHKWCASVLIFMFNKFAFRLQQEKEIYIGDLTF